VRIATTTGQPALYSRLAYFFKFYFVRQAVCASEARNRGSRHDVVMAAFLLILGDFPMRTSVVAAAALTLLAATAQAQQAPSTRTAPSAAQTKTTAPTQEVKGTWNASDFMNSRVYNMAGEQIGDVNDLVLDESGKVTAIILGVGGFLRMGEKSVSMAPDQVKRMLHSDGKPYFTINATKDQLQSAPAYTKPKAA
jgi:sporulation protein YlmC with PRC-barrel domain